MLLIAGVSLQGDLEGAASPTATAQATYLNFDRNGDPSAGENSVDFASTTDVTIVEAPGDDAADGEVAHREIRTIDLHNADNASVVARVWLDNGTVERVVFKATLATLETANYTPESGWQVHTTSGALKQVGQVGGATLTAGYGWFGDSGSVAAEVDGGAAGGFFISDGTDIVRVILSGDATMTGAGVVSVADLTIASQAQGDTFYKSAAGTTARLAGGVANRGKTMVLNTTGNPAWVGGDSKVMLEDFEATATTTQVANIQPDGTAFDPTEDILNHLYSPAGYIYCWEALSATQAVAPSIKANGLSIGGDAEDNCGYEIFTHFLGATGRPFIAQVDAAFYFLCKVICADVSDSDDFQIGFRRAELCRPNWDDYLDGCAIGVQSSADPADIYTQTMVNNGGTTDTDTQDTWANATAAQFKILVSAAGVCTFEHDLAAPGTLAAPTAAGAFTFDAGDPVIPFVRKINVGATDFDLIIDTWDVGYQ